MGKAIFYSVGSLLACLFSIGVVAQTDYRDSSAFFNAQIPLYKEWLADQGLDKYFEFRTVPVKISKDKITLDLVFKVSGRDESISAMRQLNTMYQENTGFLLEEALFLNATKLLAINPEDIAIKVENQISNNNTTDIGVSSILRYNVGDVEGSIKLFSGLRAKLKDTITIEKFQVPTRFLFSEQIEINEYYAKVKDFIDAKAKKYYEEKGGEYLRLINTKDLLSIKVENIKDEVVKNNSLFRASPYERIFVNVKIYKPGNGGLELYVSVGGNFGPARYRPQSTDWHDLEKYYRGDLKDYVSKFSDKIRGWIIEKKP